MGHLNSLVTMTEAKNVSVFEISSELLMRTLSASLGYKNPECETALQLASNLEAGKISFVFQNN